MLRRRHESLVTDPLLIMEFAHDFSSTVVDAGYVDDQSRFLALFLVGSDRPRISRSSRQGVRGDRVAEQLRIALDPP